MNTLKATAIGAEIAVVSTLAVSSYHVAFSGPSPDDWLAGAPVLTMVAPVTTVGPHNALAMGGRWYRRPISRSHARVRKVFKASSEQGAPAHRQKCTSQLS